MAESPATKVQAPVPDQDTDVCRPDTPSTVSELATEPPPTAPASDPLPDSTETQTQLLDSKNNSQPTKVRSSVFRGVCWNKKNKRWQAAINSKGKYVYLGSFVEEVKAAKKFDLAALRIRGDKAKLNFSIEDYPESEWKSGVPSELIEKYTPVKPGTVNQIKMPIGGRRLEPFALQGFRVNRDGLRNFEEMVLNRNRAGFGVAERDFLHGSASSYSASKIKKECEPFGGSSGFQKPREISLAPSPEISWKKSSEAVLRVPVVLHNSQNFAPSLPDDRRQQKSADLEHEILLDSTLPYKGGRPDGIRDKRSLSDESLFVEKAKRQCTGLGLSIEPSLPVPLLKKRPPSDCRHHNVSSVLPESARSHGGIEAAKLFVGNDNNFFGLIHRTTTRSKWAAWVWDGDTMHELGAYATENDAQVACVAAVQLVEAILRKAK